MNCSLTSSKAEKLHPTAVTTQAGSGELGREVMSLRYDLVRDTLKGMLDELERQVKADTERGRPQLASHLSNLRTSLAASVNAAHQLTEFCKPWIDVEIAAQPPEPISTLPLGQSACPATSTAR